MISPIMVMGMPISRAAFLYRPLLSRRSGKEQLVVLPAGQGKEIRVGIISCHLFAVFLGKGKTGEPVPQRPRCLPRRCDPDQPPDRR